MAGWPWLQIYEINACAAVPARSNRPCRPSPSDTIYLIYIMDIPSNHEQWMRRCLQLARGGALHASPNPMVGAVIVHAGRIIGEGYHVCCGQAHAEVNAIRSVRAADRPLLADSTIYVSLEPCAHYGRTPPCAELIVRTGIPRVVIGCADPFAKVAGRGIAILREAGIDVTVGVLEEECQALNRPFMTAQRLGRPFITLKWAVSADGFIGRWRDEADADATGPAAPTACAPAALSDERSLLRVHHLRTLHDAILVGHTTLLSDSPRLTARLWAGRQPLRVVLGRMAEGELPAGFEAYADIDTLIVALQRRGIRSLLVEGGAETLQSFIDRGLWDEAWRERSPVVLGSGVPGPRMPIGVECRCERHFGRVVEHFLGE